MSEVLGAWPALPVMLRTSHSECCHPRLDQQWDNRVATLESEHYNRVCEIHFSDIPSSRWERFAAAILMQKPFPELRRRRVSVYHDGDYVVPRAVLPDSFLGGSAPRQRQFL